MHRIIDSLVQNWRGISFMALSAFTVAVGQLLWKVSGGKNLLLLVLGFCSYGVGSVLMVFAFRYGKLSVVHPVLSISYVFGIVLGYVFLGETLRPIQYGAIVAIMLGVGLIGGGDHE